MFVLSFFSSALLSVLSSTRARTAARARGNFELEPGNPVHSDGMGGDTSELVRQRRRWTDEFGLSAGFLCYALERRVSVLISMVRKFREERL